MTERQKATAGRDRSVSEYRSVSGGTSPHETLRPRWPNQLVDQSSVDAALVDFIFREARLADESRYDEWASLWHERDALYWVPMHEDADPETEVSYIYDNQPRIAKRIAQLKTGARHSQTPPSKMRRIISNFEVVGSDDVSTTRRRQLRRCTSTGIRWSPGPAATCTGSARTARSCGWPARRCTS